MWWARCSRGGRSGAGVVAGSWSFSSQRRSRPGRRPIVKIGFVLADESCAGVRRPHCLPFGGIGLVAPPAFALPGEAPLAFPRRGGIGLVAAPAVGWREGIGLAGVDEPACGWGSGSSAGACGWGLPGSRSGVCAA